LAWQWNKGEIKAKEVLRRFLLAFINDRFRTSEIGLILQFRGMGNNSHCVMLHTVAGPSTDKEALPAIMNAVPTAKEFVHDYALLKYFCTF
jgi:hypothetical protein